MKLEPELADALGQAGGGANNGADASADNHRSEKEEKEQRTQAGILIKLAKRFGLSLFRTPDADGYADIKVKEHRETWPLRSSGFRKWLRQIYFFEEKSAPNKEALESAVETLDAEAQFSCETTHPVELRVAYHDGKIYYDLCNDRWEVVEITASGWKIVPDAPVRFRCTSTSRPQVTPVKGGKLSDLRSFLNLKNNKSWILLVSAMLKYFYEPGGHPIIENDNRAHHLASGRSVCRTCALSSGRRARSDRRGLRQLRAGPRQFVVPAAVAVRRALPLGHRRRAFGPDAIHQY